MNREYEEHPAYAMVSFHRQSGRTRCVGSELTHHETIALTIKVGQYRRDLSHDWWYGGETLAEVYFSPAQFAALLTTMNVGDGVPATFRFRCDLPPEERLVSYDPEVPDSYGLAVSEAEETAGDSLRALAELRTLIEQTQMTGEAREALLRKVDKATMEVSRNIPSVLKSFREKAEHIVTDAKASVEAFVTGVVTRTGLKALRESAPEMPTPKALAEPGDTGT